MSYVKEFIHTYQVIAVFLLVTLTACVNQIDENVKTGSEYQYREGFPEVRITALGLFNTNNDPGINVTTDIVYGSLIYSNQGGEQVAKVKAGIRLEDREAEKTVKREAFTFDVVADKNSLTTSQSTFTFRKRIPVKPGSYSIYVTVVDEKSGKKTTRKTEALIPDYQDNTPHLTSIELRSFDEETEQNGFIPETTYDVQNSKDSLSFRFQVTNAENDTIEIFSQLMKFKADTTIARRMSQPNYAQASLEYEGIEYDKRTIIQENSRRVIQPRNVIIEFKFPQLERGNYRFEATIFKTRKREESVSSKSRDFGIKSANYPSPKTPRELARPLAYLMDDKEYEQLLSIESPDSLKKEIDKFWLEEIKKTQTAQDVIAKYYRRVELANKQFNNFKEGWKTDPGMVFILFGSPWYINDEQVDVMQWSYSYNRQEFESNFFFEEPTQKNKYFPFNHFILQRNNDYFTIEFRQRENWKTGKILTRPLPF